MFDVEDYDATGRRRLAEAMGWSIRKLDFGASAVFPPGADDWTLASHDGDAACIKALPDPLRDDGDFAKLVKWLASQPNASIELECSMDGGKPMVFSWADCGQTCLAQSGDTFNAALVSAALAWLDAKEADRG